MFTIYSSNVYQKESNCLYPNAVEVTDEDSMKRAVATDYVCARYKGNYRSNENFISSDCLPVDVDNDHSEDPADWKTPADIRQAFPGVSFAIHYSRHNNKPKNGKPARPKFHVFFEIDTETDHATYADLKKLLNDIFPFFDTNALDAARFFFGTKDPEVELFPGEMTLTQFLYGDEFDKDMPGGHDRETTIPQGSRNSTMFRWAVRSMKRYGDTEESKNAYFMQAEKCQPPLSDEELNHIWRSAEKYYGKIASQPGYVSPQEYNNPNPGWEEPLPFSRFTMAAFPVDALPEAIASYVKAVAESTQTSIDMAGSIAISVLSTCLQKKYRIQGKSDWVEPLNTYVIVIAPPSERKSSVLHLMLQPVNDYEVEYNRTNAAAVEAGKMQKRVLERRQKALEEKVAKGNADPEELEKIAQEIADFKEVTPLQLYVDDITTEKLVSVIASNKGHASLISSEGGIFDTLSGIYTRNVNIDVMLKGYSGDTIRVDRIGRDSESIMDPALTILLMAQPNVVSAVLSNTTFRGRGLTARFLYSMPVSSVGSRKYRSEAVTDDIYHAYEQLVVNLLDDDYPEKPQVITLSPEADQELEAFANWLEPKLKTDYEEMADWAGKLVGNVLRISGLLCRASTYRSHDFLVTHDALQVSGKTMADAIRLGKYFLNHAQAAYSVLPEDAMYKDADLVLEKIKELHLTHFDRRKAMRVCRTFKTVDAIQPILDFLEDYGYIAQQPQKFSGTGRPPLPKYAVNPWIFEH